MLMYERVVLLYAVAATITFFKAEDGIYWGEEVCKPWKKKCKMHENLGAFTQKLLI